MKRGQITLFIILGIVMLLIGVFALYFANSLGTQEPLITEPPENMQQRLCLEAAAEGALRTAGLQGGFGTLASIPPNDNIHIGVQKGERVPKPLEEYTTEKPRFGNITFAPLCLRAGPNKPNADLDNSNTCLGGTYELFNRQTVLQYQLQEMINQNLASADCGLSGASVVFGDDDVAVYANSTAVRIPVRFKRVYNAAYMTAVSEINDIEFVANGAASVTGCEEGWNGNECLFPGMSVTMVPQGAVSVVSVTDTLKPLQGDPYVYRFAIMNRPPLVLLKVIPGIAVNFRDENFQLVVPITTVDPDSDAITAAHCKLPYTGANPPAWVSCSAAGVELSPPCEYRGPLTLNYTFFDARGEKNWILVGVNSFVPSRGESCDEPHVCYDKDGDRC